MNVGGLLSVKTNPDGSTGPYEMNITYYSAMAGTVNGIDDLGEKTVPYLAIYHDGHAGNTCCLYPEPVSAVGMIMTGSKIAGWQEV